MDFLGYTRENESFISRLKGAVKRYENKGESTQIGFIDDMMRRAAEQYFKDIGFYDFFLFSTRSDAARKFLSVGYFDEEECDIVFLNIHPDKFHLPTHRDYMGALMSLKIERKLFGDLLVTENSDAFLAVWNKGDIVSYLFENFLSCGKAKLTIQRASADKINSLEMQFEKLEVVVSSFRADCFAASITNTSRTQAKLLVEKGEFKLFSIPLFDCDHQLLPGDEFSIRGYGKYRFESVTGVTRRDRIRISLLKFGNYIERK